jgi:hypothetical protein
MKAGNFVTIQLGDAGNYTGTHFWNLMYNNMMLPPQIRDACGVGQLAIERLDQLRSQLFWEPEAGPLAGTNLPRLVAVETNVPAPSRREPVEPSKELIDPAEEAINPEVWTGKTERLVWPASESVHAFQRDRRAGRVQKSDIYQFEDTVLHWRDFQMFPMSQRSCPRIEGLHFVSDQAAPFLNTTDGIDSSASTGASKLRQPSRDLEGFRNGLDLLHGHALADQILDPIRYFAETCDLLSGFDLHASFEISENAGITAGLVENLVDTFGTNKSIFIVGIDSNANAINQRKQIALSSGAVDCTEAMLVSMLHASTSAGANDHISFLPMRVTNLRNCPDERLWVADAPDVSFDNLVSCKFSSTAGIATPLLAGRMHFDDPSDIVRNASAQEGSFPGRHRSIFELRALLRPASMGIQTKPEKRFADEYFNRRNLSTANWYEKFPDRNERTYLKQGADGREAVVAEESSIARSTLCERYSRFLDAAQNVNAADRKLFCGLYGAASLLLPHPFPRGIRQYALYNQQPGPEVARIVPSLFCETNVGQSLQTCADIQAWAAALWNRVRSAKRNPRDACWTYHELEAAVEQLHIMADSYIPPSW